MCLSGRSLVVLATVLVVASLAIHVAHVTVKGETSVLGTISERAGEEIRVGKWAITVSGVDESPYVAVGKSVFRAHSGRKIIVVHVLAKNIDSKPQALSSIKDIVLETKSNNTYNAASVNDLIRMWNVREIYVYRILSKAIQVEPLFPDKEVAPGQEASFDMLFDVPSDEVPAKLTFVVDGYKLVINLTK